MKWRSIIDATVALVWIVGMLMFGFSCEPGQCTAALLDWLVLWCVGLGAYALYLLWTRNL